MKSESPIVIQFTFRAPSTEYTRAIAETQACGVRIQEAHAAKGLATVRVRGRLPALKAYADRVKALEYRPGFFRRVLNTIGSLFLQVG